MFPGSTPPGTLGAPSSSKPVFSNEQYERNQKRLNEMQQVLDTWKAANEQGHNDFLRFQNEMSQLVEAGEQAKSMLEQLRRDGSASLPTVDPSRPLQAPVPSTSGAASIVELPSISSKSREPTSQTSSVPRTRNRQTASRGSRGGSRAPTQMPAHQQLTASQGVTTSQRQQHWQTQLGPGITPQQTRISQVSQQGTHIAPYFHGTPFHPMSYPKSSTSSLDGALDPRRLNIQPNPAQPASTIPVAPVPHRATVTPSANSSGIGSGKFQPHAAPTATVTGTSARTPGKDVPTVPKPPYLIPPAPQKPAEISPSNTSAVPSGNKPSSAATEPSIVDAGAGVGLAKDNPPTSRNTEPTPAALVAALNHWRQTSPVKSYLELHKGSSTSFYKAADGQVHMFSVKGKPIAIPQGVEIDYHYQVLNAPDKKTFWTSLVPAPQQPVSTSFSQPVDLQTSSSSNVAIPMQPAFSAETLGQDPSQPLPASSLASSSTSSISVRTLDKTRLAKDILRSLSKGKDRQRSGRVEGPKNPKFQPGLKEDADADHVQPTATHTSASQNVQSASVPMEAIQTHEDRALQVELPRDPTRNEGHSISIPEQPLTTNLTTNQLMEQNLITTQSPAPQFAPAALSSQSSDLRDSVPMVSANQDTSFTVPNWILPSDAAQIEQALAEVATAPATVAPMQSPPEEHQLPSKSSKEPLFLPSPNGSPVRQNMDIADEHEQDYEYVGHSRSKREPARQQKSQVYVLVPPPPDWVKRAKKQETSVEEYVRKRRKLPEDENVIEKSSVARSGSRWGASGSRVDDIRPMDPTEAKALKESYSALRERSCKWKACDSVLNSTESLRRHLLHHTSNEKSSSYSCSWAQCMKRFKDAKDMVTHLDQHTLSPIFCAYADCEESFRRPKDLVQHNQKQHENSRLRPLVAPYVPRMPLSMGHLPPTLPAHLIEPRDVRKPNISDERHTALGEWTLRNICGPIDVGPKRMGEALHTGYYDYDFLRSESRIPSVLSQVDDLQSSVASLLINDGMTFWGSEDPEMDNWDMVSKELEAELTEDEDETKTYDEDPALELAPVGDVGNVRSLSVGVDEKTVEMLLIG